MMFMDKLQHKGQYTAVLMNVYIKKVGGVEISPDFCKYARAVLVLNGISLVKS